jgi:hypothetical protein
MEARGLTRADVLHNTEDGMWEAGLRPVRENIRKNLANLLDDTRSISSPQTIEELVVYGLHGDTTDVRYLQGVAGHLSPPPSFDRDLVREVITSGVARAEANDQRLYYVLSRRFDFWGMSAGWAALFDGGLDHVRRLITLDLYPDRTAPIHVFDFLFDDRLGLKWPYANLDALREFQLMRFRLENLTWAHMPYYRCLPEQMALRLPDAGYQAFSELWQRGEALSLRDHMQYDVGGLDVDIAFDLGAGETLDLHISNFLLDLTGGQFMVVYIRPMRDADRARVEAITAPYHDMPPIFLWDRPDLPVVQQATWP